MPSRILTVTLVVAALGSAGWLLAVGLDELLERPLTVRPSEMLADAIVPLAGEQARIEEAASLFRRGYGRRVLLTHLPLPDVEARRRHVRHAVSTLVRGGVPRSVITIVPGIARTTHEEAHNVRDFMIDREVGSLLVVTSPWHMRRARLVFREAFADLDVSVGVRAFEEPAYATSADEDAPDGALAVARRKMIAEYLKLAAHIVGLR